MESLEEQRGRGREKRERKKSKNNVQAKKAKQNNQKIVKHNTTVSSPTHLQFEKEKVVRMSWLIIVLCVGPHQS